jgi:ribosomal-protein-alanine N-acetyltransferase
MLDSVAMKNPVVLPGSERLALRRFTIGDLDLLHSLNGDAEVMQHMGGVKTREESETMLRKRILAYYDEHPVLGVWASIEKSSGACIGMHLLNHIQGESFIQVGYVLFREYWGRGYATEMCIELLRYGFSELQLPRIVGITDLANTGSQHVLEKSGLRRNGERAFAHPAYVKAGPLAWFEQDRAAWLALRK